ncbi:MAG: hypothetical protein PPHEMADMSA_4694, partial [uncultured Paraburkholderia sp.]
MGPFLHFKYITQSGLNKAEDLARRGFAVGFALWKLQGPGILKPKSCKSCEVR